MKIICIGVVLCTMVAQYLCEARESWEQHTVHPSPDSWQPPRWAWRPQPSAHSPRRSASKRKPHSSHAAGWEPIFVPVPVPVPVPVAAPTPARVPAPAPARVQVNRGLSIGSLQGAAGGGLQTSSSSSSSLLPGSGPISATVTLSGTGGGPAIRSSTAASGLFPSAASGLFPSLAALQVGGASPAAQAAAQVVAAAQAAYNAQAAFQAQAAEATRAATQAAYAQQAAQVARNAADTVSNGLGAPLPPLPPFLN